jgi:hypothetical protein
VHGPRSEEHTYNACDPRCVPRQRAAAKASMLQLRPTRSETALRRTACVLQEGKPYNSGRDFDGLKKFVEATPPPRRRRADRTALQDCAVSLFFWKAVSLPTPRATALPALLAPPAAVLPLLLPPPPPLPPWARPSNPPTHTRRRWSRHICAGTGLTPATSAPGLGSHLPHLRPDWAHPCHICSGRVGVVSQDELEVKCLVGDTSKCSVRVSRLARSVLPHRCPSRPLHRAAWSHVVRCAAR